MNVVKVLEKRAVSAWHTVFRNQRKADRQFNYNLVARLSKFMKVVRKYDWEAVNKQEINMTKKQEEQKQEPQVDEIAAEDGEDYYIAEKAKFVAWQSPKANMKYMGLVDPNGPVLGPWDTKEDAVAVLRVMASNEGQ